MPMVPKKTEFKELSKRATTLLDFPEGVDVDWKRDNKVDAEDLVAFANSATGGVLLLGVDQVVETDGTQRPNIVGCRVGDHAVLEILNKAKDCLPPIELTVFTENLNNKPFLRVEIPTGKHVTVHGGSRSLTVPIPILAA